MTTSNLPKLQGDPVYSSQDGVFVYENPDMNSKKLGNFITKGDLMYGKYDFIGTYTGEKNGSFYELAVTFRTKNLWPFNRTVTVNGWVLGNQISINSKEDTATIAEKKEDEDFQKYLDSLTGESEEDKKKLTGSGSGESTIDTNNVIIGSVIVVTVILIIVGVIRKFRKKTPVTNQPLKS